MPYPAYLSGLTTREQIVDVVTRCVLAFDENDKDLFNSCWTTTEPEKIHCEIAGNTMTGLAEMTANCFDLVGPMDTQHMLTNFRVEVAEGADTAKVFCNALAQHHRAGEALQPGADHFLAASVYDIDAVREKDGQWKIKNWVLRVKWAQGNVAVMPGRG